MKLKSFFLKHLAFLMVAMFLFRANGFSQSEISGISYAKPGGLWYAADSAWKGRDYGEYPWTLRGRWGLKDDLGLADGPETDTVVRDVNPKYYISENIQGFLEYLPAGYTNPQNANVRYPLIIYVPGCGEMHNGQFYLHPAITSGPNARPAIPNFEFGLGRMMKKNGGYTQIVNGNSTSCDPNSKFPQFCNPPSYTNDVFASLPRELLRNGDYFSAVPVKVPGQTYNTSTGAKTGVIVLCLNMNARPTVCQRVQVTNPDGTKRWVNYYKQPTSFDLDKAIVMALREYRVDATKIYITGMSAGGGASYSYPAFGPAFARKVAGVVPVAAVENLYGNTSEAAVIVNNGVNVLAITNKYDWGSVSSPTNTITNNRSSIIALESIPGVLPNQIDSFFFLKPNQSASDWDHNAWTVAYATRGTNGQIPTQSNGSRLYVYTDPVNNEKYTTYEWMVSRQNLTLLPVLVSSFSALRQNVGIKLDWTTSTESNSDKFILERSTNGTNYSLLKEIDAAGNSSTTIKYSYLDANLPDAMYVYYRLSQRDKNGQLQIIGVKKVFLGMQGFEVSVYPSVATSTVNVEIQGVVSEQLTVRVMDLAGRQLQQQVIPPRQNRLTINTDKLSKGMYIVQVNGTSKVQTSKFIKQ